MGKNHASQYANFGSLHQFIGIGAKIAKGSKLIGMK